MEPPAHIAHLLNGLTQFNPTLAVDPSAYRLDVESGTKKVTVLWPSEAGEVFFDFHKDGQVLLSESVEYYEGEPQDDQAEDISRVVMNFLLNEVRVVHVGRLLKRHELQSNQSGRWLSVFQSPAT